MHIRLDEDIKNEEDVWELGINVGDFVGIDTRFQALESGYIKSRFLDNKAGCIVLFELAKYFAEQKLSVPVELFFSNNEEVGHGGTCGFSSTNQEMLVIDMGVVGDGLNGKETHCSICAKDSHSPYDFEMRKKLTQLAETNKIPYVVDVYPYYGSDGTAALKAGNDVRVALIGPAVAGSHGNERTHIKGIQATIDLCVKYIEDSFL